MGNFSWDHLCDIFVQVRAHAGGDWGAVVELVELEWSGAASLPVCCCGAQDLSGAVSSTFLHDRVFGYVVVCAYEVVFDQ